MLARIQAHLAAQTARFDGGSLARVLSSRQVQSCAGCGARARAHCRLRCSARAVVRAAAFDRRVLRCSCAARGCNGGGNGRRGAAASPTTSSSLPTISKTASPRAATPPAAFRLCSLHGDCVAMKRGEQAQAGAGEISTCKPTLGRRWTSVAAAFLCLLPVRPLLLDHDTQRNTCRVSG